MRRISLLCVTCAAAMMVAGGCASMSGTLKGGLIGGGGGTAVGAGIGALAGGGNDIDDTTSPIEAGLGWITKFADGKEFIDRAVMEKQKAELAAIEGAEVETVTDTNGLDAIKVTFDTGILFPTNGTALNASAKAALDKFAISLLQNPDTDVTVFGHTDSTGTLAVNERISLERAQAVRNYLETKGIASNRFLKVEGKAYTEPVASNDTAEDRAANRRVEVYISAGQAMIRQAQEGTLQ